MRTRSLRLIGESFLMWRRHRQSQLAPLQIMLQQAHVLAQLDRHDALHPSQIADFLFCDRPTASIVLKNLEARGWISRRRDPRNRRFSIIRVTGDGTAKLEEIRTRAPFADDPFDPMACFDQDEVNQLEALLAKLHSHLGALPRSGGDNT